VIIGVDEIGKLTNDTAVLGTVLSTLEAVMKDLKKLSRNSIAIVTALPTVDITTASGRVLRHVLPPPLSDDEGRALLKTLVGGDRFEGEKREADLNIMVRYCGGHPRSLCVAAHAICENPSSGVPSPSQVAQGCKWQSTVAPSYLSGAIVEMYTTNASDLKGDIGLPTHLQWLHDKAMLIQWNLDAYFTLTLPCDCSVICMTSTIEHKSFLGNRWHHRCLG
jgi:hypothetical protein